MNIKKILIATVAMFTFSIGAIAGEYTHSTPAVQGYDVVSYQTGKRPIRGNGNFVTTHEGATYQFSSAANLETFEPSDKEIFYSLYRS